MVFFLESAVGSNLQKISKVISIVKNHNDYKDVPESLKRALPIHRCLERHRAEEASRQFKVESKLRIKKEFRKKILGLFRPAKL